MIRKLATAREEEVTGGPIKWREEWTVRHSQGVHPGPFTEKAAREWMAADIKADERRQLGARGKQRLLRRYVTDWEEAE